MLPVRNTIEDPVSASHGATKTSKIRSDKERHLPNACGAEGSLHLICRVKHKRKACSNKPQAPCKTGGACFLSAVCVPRRRTSTPASDSPGCLLLQSFHKGLLSLLTEPSPKISLAITPKWGALSRHLPYAARFSCSLQRTVTNMCLCSYEDTPGTENGHCCLVQWVASALKRAFVSLQKN